MSKFRRGTIAINENGQLGYIQTVYDMEMGGVQCGGLCLDVNHAGKIWRGVNPKYVTHVDDLLKKFDGDTFTIPQPPASMAGFDSSGFYTDHKPLRDDDPVHDPVHLTTAEMTELYGKPSPRPQRRSCI